MIPLENGVETSIVMYRGGHLGFNALLYAPLVPVVTRYLSLEMALLGAVLWIGLANLPDVDQPLPGLDHRGPTHTIWFAVLVGVASGVGIVLATDAPPSAFTFGFVVGTGSVLAHLAGDVVTPMGLRPLAPFSRRHVTFDWFASRNGRVNRSLLLVGTTAFAASVLVTL